MAKDSFAGETVMRVRNLPGRRSYLTDAQADGKRTVLVQLVARRANKVRSRNTHVNWACKIARNILSSPRFLSHIDMSALTSQEKIALVSPLFSQKTADISDSSCAPDICASLRYISKVLDRPFDTALYYSS